MIAGKQNDSDIKLISIALIVSLLMHIVVMRALPWLERAKPKPPTTIIAELMTLSPPPPPVQTVVEPMPEQPVSKPEVVKKEQATPKPQAAPVLASKQAEPADSAYTVPDAKPVTETREVATPSTPEKTTAVTQSAPSNSKNTEASPAAANWSDSDVWDEFGRDLQKLCERYKQYPAIAIRRGYQGSGSVVVRFSAEGKTNSISMETSTGQKSLDDEAIAMVKKSLNELPLPAKFKGKEFKLTIPVDFKLE